MRRRGCSFDERQPGACAAELEEALDSRRSWNEDEAEALLSTFGVVLEDAAKTARVHEREAAEVEDQALDAAGEQRFQLGAEKRHGVEVELA